ncbi:MAG: hypothetical protein ABFS12_09210 [Bacteroidota bacterium]
MIKRIISFVLISFIVFSCTDKFDISEVTSSLDGNDQNNIGDTLYIQQSPVWTGFNNPQDMIVGNEPFIYVADTDNDRIVMLNIAGEFLGDLSVKKPSSISQNYKLELIIVAEFDTLINSENITFSAVYLVDLHEVGHNIKSAKVKRLIPKSSFDFSKPDRKYTGVCSFIDNSGYVSRVGPINSGTSDPDNSIRVFNRIGYQDFDRLAFIESEGTGLVSANGISSLTSVNKNSYDILVTYTGNNNFKVQWLKYISSGIDKGKYFSNLDVSADMMEIGKFGAPEDAAVDEAGNIYVADAEKDSIYKFNTFGDEMESFGGTDIMASPHAVAFHDRTLYVLDTDNNRILRFILSTDID